MYSQASQKGYQAKEHEETLDDFLDYLGKHSSPEGWVLKIGCRHRHDPGKIADLGYKAVCVDPSEKAARKARNYAEKNGNSAYFVVADMNRLPFREASISAVYAEGLIQSSNEEGMGRLREIVRKDGILYACLETDQAYGKRRRRMEEAISLIERHFRAKTTEEKKRK